MYEDPDPQLEENIAYLAGEPGKEDEGEGVMNLIQCNIHINGDILELWAFINY